MKCCGLGRMLWPCPGVALDGRDRLQPEVLLPAGPRPGEKAESPALLVPWFPGCLRQGLLQALYLLGTLVLPYWLLWATW